MERVELAEAPEITTIEITKSLPESGVAGSFYKIEGTVKIFGAIGAPPWVYAEVRKKEWYQPEAAEEVSYERGFPMPITGEFTIEFKPDKEADYEVTLLATPAPLSLPVIGVFPVVGRSDTMKIAIGERPPAVFRFSGVRIDENDVALTDHDADSGLLLEKTTADYLDITPAFEWTGPSKKVTVSIKVGYRDWLGAFSPKTGAYTRTFTLPESPAVPYAGELESPIRTPLTAAGGITDGAIEMVLKIAGEPDYISRIWNVYATKAPPEALDFDLTRPSVSKTPVDPGTSIDITCPITSRCVKPVDARAKVIIYEGSLLPGRGAKIKEYDSGTFHIEPSESTNVVVHHTAVKGTIDRRDVEVEVYVDTQLVKESEWDDVFYVGVPPEEVIDFNLTRPTVTPAEITPGTPITITCPVTSASTKEQTATAKVLIYEGSIYAGHGTLITTKTSSAFSISPGQTYNVNVQHTAIAGTIDRRDVEVEIYVGGKLVKESEWDDVYYVKEEVIEEYTLTITIDPSGGGTVTKSPNKTNYTYGELVTLTASPSSDYKFDHWSGDASGYSPSVTIAMIRNRTVTAHFKAVPPKGTISKKELEYNSARASIPAYTIPQNKRGLVHIWGRNDMATTQRLGIWWQVKNPVGAIVETYSTWEALPYTGPGGTHELIGGRFTLDKVGTYTIDVVLYMNYDNPQIVDRYTGTLCTIAAAVVSISFQASIWGVPAFGSYQKWWAYYWDPGINDFVDGGRWYGSSEKIPFSNVQPGGYLAVYLMRDSLVSSQYTSPTFQAVNGGIYQYDVQLGRVTKIG